MDSGAKKLIYSRRDAHKVMQEIALQVQFCTKAWVGYGQGRVVILKDDYRGLKSYYAYEEGVFTFHDGKGGEQRVSIEEITEVKGINKKVAGDIKKGLR